MRVFSDKAEDSCPTAKPLKRSSVAMQYFILVSSRLEFGTDMLRLILSRTRGPRRSDYLARKRKIFPFPARKGRCQCRGAWDNARSGHSDRDLSAGRPPGSSVG